MPKFRGFRLRKPKKEAEEKEQQIRLEEKKRAEEERRLYERLISLRTDYRILENYPLYDPWARALILERKTDGSIIYFVDEIPLTSEERQIYERIMDILYWELEPAPSGVDPVEHFKNQASSIIKRFALRFKSTIHPGISWGKIEYYILRDTIEYDVITPLMRDPAIEDISCDGVGKPVYVWHQRYESIPTNIRFTREEDLDSLVVKLAHKAGKHVSVAFPIVDAILPEGHRLAATFKKEVSRHGSTFTIRKFREKPLSIVDLIRGGTVSSELAAYFWKLMEYNMTGLIMGVTGAGKTTLLNAIATLLRPTIKIVTIEDTPELRLTHENWVQLYSRPSYGFEAGLAEITLYDLVRVSLRYRPDVLIVGEVRGEEAKVLFQAVASVSWDTPILIRNSVTGEISIVPIGEFVDKYYLPGEERIVKEVDGYEVLSHDGFKAVWKPIKYVLRHSADEIYLIEAEGGLKLEATGNHSVFVLDEETLAIKEKKVEDLTVDDLLVSFSGIMNGETKEQHNIKVVNINETVSKGVVALQQLRGHVSSNMEGVHLDEEMGFLLGVYIADGCVKEHRGKRVCFTMGSTEEHLMNKLMSIIRKKFG
ncbi:MAG: Flp pilus assembly complex ATPase component TadA, partial [Desulfurococcales archaeon]|nr:Flp pilus assembly complex ATPase component TadA [Desulfurococcales archaeon]